MLHIILLILKVIGTILLVLLGILLLILLTVLLVPIRYRVDVEHGEAFRMEGRASWLMHFIHTKFSYLEGKPHIRIRVLGFILYDNLRPKVSKFKIKKKKNVVRRKNERKSKTKAVSNREKDKVIIKDNKSDTISIIETHKNLDKNDGRLENEVSDELPEALRKYSIYEALDEEAIKEEAIKEEAIKEEAIKEEEAKAEIKAEIKARDEDNKEQEQQNSDDRKKSFFQKILFKIISIKEKIRTFFGELKNKIVKLFDTIFNIKQKFGLISEFIKNELNREGFRLTYKSLKKLLRHILPTKLKSKIIFGTGDPCSTGQALGMMGILYSFYGDKIQIIPDFENTRLEGTHYAKGRIRLVTILIIVIKLMLDKRFKKLKRNFIILKEAL